jgi:death-on-curing protein
LTVYLSAAQIHELHRIQIEHYGGSSGCRDRAAVESAAARPALTFGGEDLYPDVASKAAGLLHSLVRNRGFVDGNKRVGSHAAMLFLALNGFQTDVTPMQLEEITLAVARGEHEAGSLTIWFRQRTSRPD